MIGQDSRRPKIPALVYIGVVVGAGLGAMIGNILCLGYDVLYGPWFPQAGVDPQPAGWVGWWLGGGAVVGGAVGFVLSGTLAAVYTGLIIGLESLLGRFMEQNAQPLLIVLSTIAIAALFQPLRGRIQPLIDHRFYRKKYDMAKTLAAFSATLRNEVDLEQLSSQLLALVNETMQPEHTSLWLRAPEQRAGRTPRDAEGLPQH